MNARILVARLLEDEVEDFFDRAKFGYAVRYQSGGGLIYYWTGRDKVLDPKTMDYSSWNEDINYALLFDTKEEAFRHAAHWAEMDQASPGRYDVVSRLAESDEVGDFFDRNLDAMAYPSPEQCRYELRVDAESERPSRHFQDDPEAVQWIMAELRRGNIYAWFSACCEAHWTDSEGNEFVGRDYLGCCSYKSREDFMSEDGYWPQMKDEAYDDLMKNIRTFRGKPSQA